MAKAKTKATSKAKAKPLRPQKPQKKQSRLSVCIPKWGSCAR